MSADQGDENQFGHAFEESTEELYENAPCGYLSTTPDGRIVKVNQTFAGWIGCERQELTSGMRFAELLTIGGRIFYETHFASLLHLHGQVREIALDVVCRQGSVLPTFINAVQRRDTAGKPILHRITVFDATDRRSYERELLMARKRAEEIASELALVNSELSQSNTALLKANEELGQFAYAASHDLQEPLRTMTAYAQLLARRHQDAPDQETKKFVQNIVDGSQRMQILIEDLLTFSQAQGSHLLLRPTNLEQALAIALSNLSSAITESNAMITHGPLPVMMADAARIVQLLQNLVGNAIKYRKPAEAPRVHISASTVENGEALISVEDNGLGFDAIYAEQIFGMFKRLHGRNIPGTGIGLALCKKIVEAHGGRIWATSTPGIGSSFYFTISDRLAS
jgi:sigma-B regulation protein RsbU (phosphoserine phosphatase)